MPKYTVIILDDYDAKEGTATEWDLPYEFLVFDQRFDYKAPDQENERWVVRELRGKSLLVAPNPGNREGGDPKKARVS